MYEGTLYGQWEALVTFQQMIVLCDADGMLDMTSQAIAARTSIPLKIIRKGIMVLEAPDPCSRTPDQEGRRIELIDAHRPWGWHIVNHEKYRAMQDAEIIRAQTRERVRKHRATKCDVTVTDGNGQKRHTDTDTNTDTDTKRTRTSRVAALPDWLPLESWNAWLEVRTRNRAPNTTRALQLAITELAKLKAAGQNIVAVLDQSTLRGWRGVFAVKGDDSVPDYSHLTQEPS